jgi:hypothetical protein
MDSVHMASQAISVRLLSAKKNQDEFELAARIAQMFSGGLFAAVAVYLIVTNSTRLSYIHRAAIEKRLTVCCHIMTIVAAISAFLNFFQLTEVDNIELPGQKNQYVVDTARPLEWITTCPLIQLALVLMGGSRIPEYRRMLMPFLAALVIFFGYLTLFVTTPWTWILYACSAITHIIGMSFNRQQIIEHSKGLEGMFTGDSEFRKATLIVLATWFPFPFWFLLSPEGLNVITDITVIQMGWATLNILAKFTMIFYMQRIKDNYCNQLKVRRAVAQEKQWQAGKKGVPNNWDRQSWEFEEFGPPEEDEENQDSKRMSPQLGACITETMNFLGMAEHSERFLRLLKQANIHTMEDVTRLDKETCEQMLLPYDLIGAIQKRHKVWSLEMVDDAEVGLDVAEKHYKQKDSAEKYQNLSAAYSERMAMNGGPYEMARVMSDGSYIKGSGKGNLRIVWPASQESPTFDGAAVGGQLLTNSGEEIKTAQDLDAIMLGSTFEQQLESKLCAKFELLFKGLEKKIDGCGEKVEEINKKIEKSHSLLEAKVDYVFASQAIKHREETKMDLNIVMEVFADRILASSEAIKNTLKDSSTEKLLQDVTERIDRSGEEVNARLDSVMSQFEGPINEANQMYAQLPSPHLQNSQSQNFRQPMSTRDAAQSRMQAEIDAQVEQRLLQMQMGAQGPDDFHGFVSQQQKVMAMSKKGIQTTPQNSRPQSSSRQRSGGIEGASMQPAMQANATTPLTNANFGNPGTADGVVDDQASW